jgi:hypothetical protein
MVLLSQIGRKMGLSKKQIERQDFVDNSVFKLMQELNPTDKPFDWDIEMIAAIRENIQDYIISKTNCSERDFYPYIEE